MLPLLKVIIFLYNTQQYNIFLFHKETGSRPHLQSLADSLKHFKLTKDYEDYELKKALMCILATLSSDSAAVKIMTQKKVIRSLLSFVIQNDKVTGTWNSAQFEELQLMVIIIVYILYTLSVGS